jgi:hypothetical protein
MRRFADLKEEQAQELSKKQSTRWPGEATKFFRAVRAGDLNAASNLLAAIEKKYRSFPPPTNGWTGFMTRTYSSLHRFGVTPNNYWPNFRGPEWMPIAEAKGAMIQFHEWDPELLMFFGTNIISSIPTNSIYMADTDAGRFIVYVLSKSSREGVPFFTLSQHMLADGSYLEYLRGIFRDRIYVLSPQESSAAFSAYVKDVQARAQAGRLKPGENFTNLGGGRTSISGQAAVTQVNALLARTLFEKNPGFDFYVEVNMPLEWMYPHLLPHGLILKLNRQPLDSIDPALIEQDRVYWGEIVHKLTGLEIAQDTSLSQLSEFAAQVYLRKDYRQFKGNPRFATNAPAQQGFARLRFSIADIYAWRATNTTDHADQSQMYSAADLAFRQAFALCPTAIELSQYGELLLSQNRTNEFQLLLQTVRNIAPDGSAAAALSGLLSHPPQ